MKPWDIRCQVSSKMNTDPFILHFAFWIQPVLFLIHDNAFSSTSGYYFDNLLQENLYKCLCILITMHD